MAAIGGRAASLTRVADDAARIAQFFDGGLVVTRDDAAQVTHNALVRLSVPATPLQHPTGHAAASAYVEGGFRFESAAPNTSWKATVELPEGMTDVKVVNTTASHVLNGRTLVAEGVTNRVGRDGFTITGSLDALTAPSLVRTGNQMTFDEGILPRLIEAEGVTRLPQTSRQLEVIAPIGWESKAGFADVSRSGMRGHVSGPHYEMHGGVEEPIRELVEYTGRFEDQRVAGPAYLRLAAQDAAENAAESIIGPLVFRGAG